MDCIMVFLTVGRNFPIGEVIGRFLYGKAALRDEA